MLYNLDTMNGELFEVVNFVATTHPLGQKRCRRGDACRVTSYFVNIDDSPSASLVGGIFYIQKVGNAMKAVCVKSYYDK